AERVMQQQVARSRVVRAREMPDDRVEAERALQRIALESAVEPGAGAARQQVPQRCDAAAAEGAEPRQLRGRPQMLPPAAGRIDGRFEQQPPEQVRDGAELLRER